MKKRLILVTMTLLAAVGLLVTPQLAVAQIDDNLCRGSNLDFDRTAVADCETDTTTTVNNTVALVINVLSLVIGVVAVIMIIIGGLKYITSSGESSNIQGAKNTILYAIIGLVIVALAQIIVRYVLVQTANAGP